MKLFPSKYMESEDMDFVNKVELLTDMKTHMDETEGQIGKDSYNRMYKRFCNSIRKLINETSVIGLIGTVEEEKKKVVICVYDVESTEDNFFEQYFDQEAQLPFILLEEAV